MRLMAQLITIKTDNILGFTCKVTSTIAMPTRVLLTVMGQAHQKLAKMKIAREWLLNTHVILSNTIIAT